MGGRAVSVSVFVSVLCSCVDLSRGAGYPLPARIPIDMCAVREGIGAVEHPVEHGEDLATSKGLDLSTKKT